MSRSLPITRQVARPVRFRVAVTLLAAGVAVHVEDVLANEHGMGHHLAGMPVGPKMIAGMSAIVVGIVLAATALVERSGGAPAAALSASRLESGRFTRRHAVLGIVATVALCIDVMKPATIGFVLPSLRDEYGLSAIQASTLSIVALGGTALGSLLWGHVADRMGRRPAILLAALMFVGTSVCGAMPTFGLNVIMCFLMGLAAGGMLPVILTLVAELTPRGSRGMLVVLVAGLGASGGYLAASGAAALLADPFGWRVLWLVGFPTGLALLALLVLIPESPRFLLLHGRGEEADHVCRHYGMRPAAEPETAGPRSAAPVRAPLFQPPYRARTLALGGYGFSWGLVNFGFLTWLPTMMGGGEEARASVADLIAWSALFAVPGSVAFAILYARWSTKWTLVAAGVTAVGALVLVAAAATRDATDVVFGATLALLLVSLSGMNSIVLPYSAEIVPTELRGRASGVVAAGGKLGGLLGLVLVGLIVDSTAGLALPALLLIAPLLIALLLLSRAAHETRGIGLVEAAILRPAPDADPP